MNIDERLKNLGITKISDANKLDDAFEFVKQVEKEYLSENEITVPKDFDKNGSHYLQMILMMAVEKLLDTETKLKQDNVIVPKSELNIKELEDIQPFLDFKPLPNEWIPTTKLQRDYSNCGYNEAMALIKQIVAKKG